MNPLLNELNGYTNINLILQLFARSLLFLYDKVTYARYKYFYKNNLILYKYHCANFKPRHLILFVAFFFMGIKCNEHCSCATT